MQILVNTDNQISGNEEFARGVEADVAAALGRFGAWLTRVEVHLTVEGHGSSLSKDNKRCLIEARPAGLRPVTVSDDAATLEQAVSGAVDKMERLLDSLTTKLRDSDRTAATVVEPEEAPSAD